MKTRLDDFYGNFATEEETAKSIHDLYEKTGYVIDTHTAVATTVYEKYKQETGDKTTTVIASTASPFKFTRAVMRAIDRDDASVSDLDLVDALSDAANVKIPNAIEEIRHAEIRHNKVCDVDKMQQSVKEFLGI
jgi:threonine synthase